MINSKDIYKWNNHPWTDASSIAYSNNTASDSLIYLNYKVYKLNWWKNIVIGDWLIAKAFLWLHIDKNILVFASGVSNSNEENQSAFNQEKQLLIDINKNFPNFTMVYFSSCSIFDPWLVNKAYIIHKKDMEVLICKICSSYCILRLPIIVGESNNPNTLTNYLYNNIVNGYSFNIWKNAKRYLVNVDDVYTIAEKLLANDIAMNDVVNVAFSEYTILDIVKMLEQITGKQAIYTLNNEWWSYPLDTNIINWLFPDLVSKNSSDYLEWMLKKYYSK